MGRLLTLRRNLSRLLTRNEVDDNFVGVATDFTGEVDPATLEGAYVLPYMRWADIGTGWVRRRNVANDAWVNEQRLHRASLAIFGADEVPAEDVGPICIVGKGYAEWDSAGGGYRLQPGRPVGTPDWWSQRSSVPSGQIPLDGQTVSRATFPELAALVVAGHVPVVAEADWSADPTKRGAYTLGDGSTTIRVPDYNGKSAGALGAVFRRGDGAMSSGVAGLIQRDAMQGHRHGPIRISPAGVTSGGVTLNNVTGSGAFAGADLVGEPSSDGGNGTPRTSAETRALNIGGVWTIHAFGAVVNPGSADAAQLASDYAVLNATVQTLRNRPYAHGQCRMNWVSSTQIILVPHNGNGLIINGKQYYISADGVTLSNAGLVPSGHYYIYAKDNGSGGIALEAMAKSSNPHSRHTDGVEIRTGDPTRTLVGQVVTNASTWFVNTAQHRWTISWFNRITYGAAETPINSNTASTSYVKLTVGLNILGWAGDSASVNVTGVCFSTGPGGAVGAYAILTVDGGGFAGGHGYTMAQQNWQYAVAISGEYLFQTDATVNFAVYGLTNNGTIPVTFRNDLTCRHLI